jgi:hypothetical protein
MSRSTKNRQIEEMATGGHRDLPFNAPANETANARVDMLGPFRHANCAIDLSAVATTMGGVDADAPVSILAHSSGKIIGIAYKFSANITAGGTSAATVQASIAPSGKTPAAAGDAVLVASGGSDPQLAVADESVEVAFKKGDGLGVNLSTSHTFAPTTDDFDAYLIVRWDASPAVPA